MLLKSNLRILTFVFIVDQVCDHCQKRGGHIFCRQRGCGTRAHYPCAVAHHWLLQEDEFLAFCPAHFNQHVT